MHAGKVRGVHVQPNVAVRTGPRANIPNSAAERQYEAPVGVVSGVVGVLLSTAYPVAAGVAIPRAQPLSYCCRSPPPGHQNTTFRTARAIGVATFMTEPVHAEAMTTSGRSR